MSRILHSQDDKDYDEDEPNDDDGSETDTVLGEALRSSQWGVDPLQVKEGDPWDGKRLPMTAPRVPPRVPGSWTMERVGPPEAKHMHVSLTDDFEAKLRALTTI